MVNKSLSELSSYNPMKTVAWAEIKNRSRTLKGMGLKGVFSNDVNRAEVFTHSVGGVRFDFSKNYIDDGLLSLFKNLAAKSGLSEWRERMIDGDVVNVSEQRSVLHAALRSSFFGTKADQNEARSSLSALDLLAERFRSGNALTTDGQKFDHVIFIGIGGSALGPELLVEALGYDQKPTFDTHIVSNIDAHALKPVLQKCDPRKTLLIVASKTFTTQETLTNAETVLQWIGSASITAPKDHVIGITAAPENALNFGVKPDHVLSFPNWVGGRYSIWSPVAAPFVFAYGMKAFDQFLAGAREMDEHFISAPYECQVPFISACLDIAYTNFFDAQSRGVFVYDQRLKLLPDYLQQLETESNGKDKTRFGEAVSWKTSPVIWGGVGTDCQHSVFQMMHQGSNFIPAEFIGVVNPDHDEDGHHQKLLANMLAQSSALMRGRSFEEAHDALPGAVYMDAERRKQLASAKSFAGNRPSTTILIDQLTPDALGCLIAYYEHKTFISGVLLNINSYDQMGVELGKEMASEILQTLSEDSGSGSDLDLSTKAALLHIRNTSKDRR